MRTAIFCLLITLISKNSFFLCVDNHDLSRDRFCNCVTFFSLIWLLWSVWSQLKTAASTLKKESMFWAFNVVAFFSLICLLWSVWIPPQLKTAASTLEQESMFWAERGRSERDLLRQCAAAPNSESHWLPDSQRRYSNSARFSSKQSSLACRV